MSQPIIEVQGLSKRYKIAHSQGQYRSFKEEVSRTLQKPLAMLRGTNEKKEDFWALRDVSFSLNEGDILGIIGRNGSGKSTLLKILTRIVDPTEGRAIMRGRVASLLEVGTGFHPELTGRENIFLNGSILGMSQREIRSKFKEIIEFSEIGQFLDTPVKFYSSGMYVRLAFAVAAHLDPEILIVDEVLAVGDAQFQEKCVNRMSVIAKQGKTVLFVSHNMALTRSLCNKGVLMKDGRATTFDDVDELAIAYLAKSHHTVPGKGVVVNVGDLSFSNFMLNGKSVKSNIVIPSGDLIDIELDYTDKGKSKDLLVGFGLRKVASDDYPVFVHNRLEDVEHKTGKSGKIKARLHVPRLSPGVYSFEFHAWANGELLMEEDEICKFRILETPAFSTQQLHAAFPSSVMIDTDWEFVKK